MKKEDVKNENTFLNIPFFYCMSQISGLSQ